MSIGKHIQLAIKRLLDLVVGIPALLIVAIPFAIIALAIKLDSKGTAFFKQERAGQNGKIFRAWKFRTMVEGAIHKGLGYTVAQDDPRITRVGKILREWGLDELPQIINVLKGEMSLVGPRPTLLYQVEQYDEFQRRRLQAKPGVTSLAVISGRNALRWKERIELDVWYVEHQSIWLDIKVLLKTFWVVLIKREGIYGEGGVNDPFVNPPSVPKDHHAQ